MNIKIIGLGGIGSYLVSILSRYINHADYEKVSILLIDGDSYEVKNQNRQDFTAMGNKADVKAEELIKIFPAINIEPWDKYITIENISDIISEDDIIFMCVDNHKTRKLVSDYTVKLKNVVLISGGNDYTDGNVQIFIRKGGNNLTPPITDYHHEIQNPDDKSPDEMSCEELALSGTPQLLFTNLSVVALMCQAFYNLVEAEEDLTRSEIYFDMKKMSAHSTVRKPITN